MHRARNLVNLYFQFHGFSFVIKLNEVLDEVEENTLICFWRAIRFLIIEMSFNLIIYLEQLQNTPH